MTSLISSGQILKSDGKGRVRTPKSRQKELLDEFERSGLSGAKFALVTGVKYSTFTAWVARRHKLRQAQAPHQSLKVPVGDSETKVRTGVAWVEAVVDSGRCQASVLVVHLPGGVRTEVSSASQALLAAQLLMALEGKAGC